MIINIGNECTSCRRDTSIGSNLFVNRIPSGTEKLEGYLCFECQPMKCNKCHEPRTDIRERYSFGVYAGTFCTDCCYGYRDHCCIDQAQGSPNDLDEQYWED